MRGSVSGRDEKLLCPHIFHLWTVGIYTLKSCVPIGFPSGQEGSLYVLWFNFILSLKFIFLCFKQIHYHTLSYPKTKEYNIKTKDKIEPQHTPNCINVIIKKAKDKNRQTGINYSVAMRKTF